MKYKALVKTLNCEKQTNNPLKLYNKDTID